MIPAKKQPKKKVVKKESTTQPELVALQKELQAKNELISKLVAAQGSEVVLDTSQIVKALKAVNPVITVNVPKQKRPQAYEIERDAQNNITQVVPVF